MLTKYKIQMGWIEARKKCEARSSRLLSLSGQEQTQQLVRHVRWWQPTIRLFVCIGNSFSGNERGRSWTSSGPGGTMWKLRGSGSGLEAEDQVGVQMLMLQTLHSVLGLKKSKMICVKLETLVGGRRVCLSQSKKTASSGSLSFTEAAGNSIKQQHSKVAHIHLHLWCSRPAVGWHGASCCNNFSFICEIPTSAWVDNHSKILEKLTSESAMIPYKPPSQLSFKRHEIKTKSRSAFLVNLF